MGAGRSATGLVGLLLVASCSSDAPSDRSSRAVDVSQIPLAAERMGFAVSDEAVIVGGGGVPTFGVETPVHDVWSITQGHGATELPPLPADGFVEGLTGTQMGDTLVLGAMDCAYGTGQTTGMLGCGKPRVPVLWTRAASEDRWSRHVLPDDVVAPVWPDEIDDNLSSRLLLKVFGHHDGRAFVAFTSRDRTRFISFDPADGRFDVLGDAPPLGGTHNTTPFCLEDTGAILHLRRHTTDATDSAAGPTTIGVSVGRLEPDGEWSEGPRLSVEEVDGPSMDLECPARRDPLVGLSTYYAQTPIVATVDPESLVLSVWEHVTDRLANLLVGVPAGVKKDLSFVGTAPNGDLVVEAANGLLGPPEGHGRYALYTLDDQGDLAAVEGMQNISEDATVFVAGDLVGHVRFDQGHIRVRRLG